MNKREKLEKKVADAKHMSKPEADNAVVVRDADGRWLYEMYTAGHKVQVNDPDVIEGMGSNRKITLKTPDSERPLGVDETIISFHSRTDLP